MRKACREEYGRPKNVPPFLGYPLCTQFQHPSSKNTRHTLTALLDPARRGGRATSVRRSMMSGLGCRPSGRPNWRRRHS